MLKAQTVIPAGNASFRDTITLDREDRYRRRIAMKTDGGLIFLLDLPEPTYLNDGDYLALEDGSFICVKAADEPLLKVTTSDPRLFSKLAWHLGNRHTPAEITVDALYIRPDHVLRDMLTRLGATVTPVERAFDPEGGAYGHKGALSEGHHHGHSHD